MAKLNGVKIIDAVGGEIQRVAYNGDIYVKSAEGKVEAAGDLLLALDSHDDRTAGEFYRVATFNGEYVRWVEDDGEFNGQSNKYLAGSFNVFAKVAVQSDVDLTQRVEELEAEVTKLKAQQTVEMDVEAVSKPKLKAGDFVKFTKRGDYNSADITLNKPYLVFEDSYGDLSFKDDADDYREEPLEETDCYEILSEEEVAEHRESDKWAKIGRKVNEFRKGDIVRVIKDASAKPVGTLFVVNSGGRVIVTCDAGFGYGTKSHIELITPVDARFDK